MMEAIVFICVLLQKRGLLFWNDARGTLVKGDRELRYNNPVEILFPAERFRVFIQNIDEGLLLISVDAL
jgi:hypothetical protein